MKLPYAVMFALSVGLAYLWVYVAAVLQLSLWATVLVGLALGTLWARFVLRHR